MEQNKKIELFFAVFGNISLLNLKNFIEKNSSKNNIEEKNLHNNLNNDKNKLIFTSTNFYQLIAKHLTKIKNNQTKIDDIFKKLVEHIRLIRNYYSHNNSHKDYDDNKAKWEHSHNEFTDKIKEIFAKSGLGINFKEFKEREWTAFFIQLFLYQSQWNDFYEHSKNVMEEPPLFYRKFRVRLRKMVIKENFSFEIINYLKNFNNTKKRKKAFLRIASKMLNYFLKKNKLKFSFTRQNRRGLIIECKFEKSGDVKHFNFQGIRQILLYQATMIKKNKHFYLNESNFAKKEIKSEMQDINDNYYQINHKIFLKKISDNSKIPVNHLLKLLSKTLKHLENDYENGLGQTLFNQLLQFLQTENRRYFNEEHDTSKKLKKLLKINSNIDASEWIVKVKKFLREKVTIEKYQIIFKAKQVKKITKPNIWTKNPKLSFFAKSEISPSSLYEPLFNFQNKKSQKNNLIRKLIAPILIFYFYNQKELDNDYLDLEEIKNLFNENTEQPIEWETIKTCFNKRILKTKNKLITYRLENGEKLKTKISYDDPITIFSNYEIINSKIFFEVAKLIEKNTNNNISINDIIKHVKQYKDRELEFVNWALNNESKKQRNFIMHRSLSNFENWSELESLINKKSYQLPKKQNKSHQNFTKSNIDFDDKIKKFNEEITQ